MLGVERRRSSTRVGRETPELCVVRLRKLAISSCEGRLEGCVDRYRGKEAFWKHVVKTFHDYHTKKETMDRCWRLKSAVIKSILDANGRNDYELPHGYVEWKPIVQAITDSSSDDDEPLARALTFEDAEGVLPCSQAHSLPR